LRGANLPLGISFFTFQQIAYLVDAHRGEAGEYHITDYLLFVTFFPQLIAGPIVHHKEMMPQFARGRGGVGWQRHFPVGLAPSSPSACSRRSSSPTTPPSSPARSSSSPPRAPATDHFRGLGRRARLRGPDLLRLLRLLGHGDRLGPAVRHPPAAQLPLALQGDLIIEFWRRWHMTLSRFLRDYLYIPLGGNRLGKPRRYTNLMITMLLGGLWHGAGWTFVMWGAVDSDRQRSLRLNGNQRGSSNPRHAGSDQFQGRNHPVADQRPYVESRVLEWTRGVSTRWRPNLRG
jgi:alginate O-acetyltransferase complex protein AlgI